MTLRWLVCGGHSNETPRAWWLQLFGVIELRLSRSQATVLLGPAGLFVFLELSWGCVRDRY